MAIHWSVPHLKTLIPPGHHARLPEAYCDPFSGTADKTTIYNSASGEVLKELDMPGMIRVDRNMRALCSEGVEIQYSKALSSLTYENNGVTATFADGTTAFAISLSVPMAHIPPSGPNSWEKKLLHQGHRT